MSPALLLKELEAQSIHPRGTGVMTSFPNILLYHPISTLVSGLCVPAVPCAMSMFTSMLNHHFIWSFVLFWFCSDSCQNETLRWRLGEEAEALFPFWSRDFVFFLLLPEDQRNEVGLYPSPQWSKGVLVGLSFLQLRLRTGLSPPSTPPKALSLGLERKPPPAIRAHPFGWEQGWTSLRWGEEGTHEVSCYMSYVLYL